MFDTYKLTLDRYVCSNIDESVSEKETRLAEINSNLLDLEHKLKLMQLLQTTEGSIPTPSIQKTKPSVTKDQPSKEEDTTSVSQTLEDQAQVLEGKDDAPSVSATSVAATVGEEEPPATLADESHVELDEEQEDETRDEAFDDEDDESKDQEVEGAEELPAMEEEGSIEVALKEQILSEGVSKAKEQTKTHQAVKLSSQQGASSQAVSLIYNI